MVVSRDYSSLAVERHLQLVLTLTTMCKQVPQVAPSGAPGEEVSFYCQFAERFCFYFKSEIDIVFCQMPFLCLRK